MKKIIFVIMLLVSAQMLMSDVFSLERSGEYAVYLDKRGDFDFYRVYWGHNINEGGMAFFIRNIDRKTGESVNYMIQLMKTDEGELEISQMKGLGKNDPPAFSQAIPDLMNFIETASRWSPAEGRQAVEHWAPKYTEVFHFDCNFPVFGFDSFGLEGDEPAYHLVSGGAFGIDELDDFFQLELSEEPEQKGRRGLDMPVREEFDAGLLQYRLTLDANWSPNNEIGFPGYWLSVYSYRDSQIMLESMDWNDLETAGITDVETFIRITSYSPGDIIFRNGMKLEEDGESRIQSYYLIDSNSNYNYIERKIWLDDGVLYVLNFSTFADIYDQNREYYRKIIESFRIKE